MHQNRWVEACNVLNEKKGKGRKRRKEMRELQRSGAFMLLIFLETGGSGFGRKQMRKEVV